MNIAQRGSIFLIRAYQAVLSPALAVFFGPSGRCRYTPSCSQYALEAVQLHGATRGSYLAFKRLCRCHPWAAFGYDPVPKPANHSHGFSQQEKILNTVQTCGCPQSKTNENTSGNAVNWHLDLSGHGS